MKKVIITSDFSYGREYETEMTDILKIAEKFGRCESGEKVALYEDDELVAMAMYSSEEGGFYYEVEIQ